MENRLDKELDLLHKHVVEFGALCELAVTNASISLAKNDKQMAESVIELERETNKKEREIENLCMKIILKQHPVAKDLRNLSSTLKMITDMERIADQARDISEIVLSTPIQYNEKLQNMAEATIKMLTDSIDCYVSQNLEDCHSVVLFDNVIDDFYEQMQADVVDMVSKDVSKTLEAMYILMIAKYFERIADHSMNIAEWVVFHITGSHEE
ncbi:MAG: phosphate signaling complex protein PhoU [Clostridia bacterium]